MTAAQTDLYFEATIYADDKAALARALRHVIATIEADPQGEVDIDSDDDTSTITALSYIRGLSEEEA